MYKYALTLCLPLALVAGHKIEISDKDIDMLNSAISIQEEDELLSKYLPKDLPKPRAGIVINNNARFEKSISTLIKYDNQAAKMAKEKLEQEQQLNNTGYLIIDNKVFNDDKVANYKDLKLAFNYKPIRFKNKVKKYGFAPYGLINEKDEWLGIVEIFRDPSIGYCTYTKYNYKKAGGSVSLDGNMVTHKINGKATVISTHGLSGVGFMYNINWFDDEYDYKLECANKTKAYYKRDYLIQLAREIDNNG